MHSYDANEEENDDSSGVSTFYRGVSIGAANNMMKLENMNDRASLFLQEAAHLFSLMSAVSMASLRADMEGCASPLVDYVPGQKFPP